MEETSPVPRAVLLTHLPPPQIRVRNTLNFCRPAEEGGQSSYVPRAALSVCSNVRVRKLGLLDQFVRKREQRGRHGETERLGNLDVDDQLELSRLLDGEVGGLCPLQDLVHEGGKPPVEEDEARPVRH